MKKRIFSVGIALCLTFTQIPVYAMSMFSDGSEETSVFSSDSAFTDEPTVVELLQALIDALPNVEELELLNKETQTVVYEQAQDACDILETLETDEAARVIGVEKLTAVMEWFNSQMRTLDNSENITTVNTKEGLKDAIAKGGSIKLTNDIIIDATLSIDTTVILDLNGCMIKYESNSDGSVIRINQNGNLTLEDTSNAKTGKITGGHSSEGGGVYNYGTFTMKGGSITNCSASNEGGGVCNYGTFTMKGGSITNCSASNNGGGVFNGTSGRFTIKSGIIYGSIQGPVINDGCYQVTYKVDDNIYARQWVTTDDITTIEKPISPTVTGMIFDDKWYIMYGSVKTAWDFSKTVKSDLELHAGLSLIDYTIHYDLNGGEVSDPGNPVAYNVKSEDITLQNPTRKDYEFIGWSGTDLTGESNKTVRIQKGSIGGRNYTAHWRDAANPVITGVEDGKTYCAEQTVTITDNEAIKSVTVNEDPVTLTGGKFTLLPADGVQTIIATDNAGNETKVTVTVNDGHMDKNKDHYCDICTYEVSKHSGGTATCKDKAICKYCGKSYGEVDKSNHAGGTKVCNAVSATCTTAGYSGDVYCAGCDTYLEPGYTIAAYGHKYDDGVITTEPTTEKDGIKTYTCIHCKNTKTENLGRIGDGTAYLNGSFDKKGWKVLNALIHDLEEGNSLTICMNGGTILPAEALTELKGRNITLILDLGNGFNWTINGISVTSEELTDTDLAVKKTGGNIPFTLIKKAAGDDPYAELHLAMPTDAGFTGNLLIAQGYDTTKVLWANLFRYDPITGTLLCTQAVPNGDGMAFSLTQGHDYLIVYSSQYFVGTVIDTEDSAADEELQPDRAVIKSTSVDKNKLAVRMESGCKGAEGYDIVVGKKDMLKTQDFRYVKYDLTGTKATFTYLPKGTWYIAGRAWRLDASGQKVYGSWSKVQKVKVTVKTPAQTKITKVNVEGSTVTVTYKKSKYADGYRIVLG